MSASHSHHTHHEAGAHHGGHARQGDHDHHRGNTRSMAVSATLHCLTGCAIGEIAGLMIGTAIGLATGWTIALSVTLAFFFGYTLSTLPLLRAGLGVGTALSVVLAADTLSIATMEVVDNLVMAVLPGAMGAGLVNVVFWVGMMIAFTAAFFAAYPVNAYLLARGKGHALTHSYHGAASPSGVRRFIPAFTTPGLVGALVAFLLGGLIVAAAAESGAGAGHAAPAGVVSVSEADSTR